jgi:hypothetical protein
VFIAGKPSMQASFPTIREGELNTKTWGNIFASPNKTVKVPGIEKYKDITDEKLIEDAKREAREHLSSRFPSYFE